MDGGEDRRERGRRGCGCCWQVGGIFVREGVRMFCSGLGRC